MVKPHIILIPGAWHKGSCYDRLIPFLRDCGYVATALTLPSVGAEPPITSIDPDLAHVRKVVEPLLNDNQDVVVVMHSYAGVVGTTSLSGFAKRDRLANNQPGGVVALVYLCAWMPDIGQTVTDLGGGRGGTLGASAVETEGDYLRHLKPIEAFYHDLPRELAEQEAKKLVHHSAPTLGGVATYAAWRDIPTTYLVCNGDVTIEPAKQWGCIERARKKAEIQVVECGSGHSPFLSMPEVVSKVIRQAAGEKLQD